MKREVTTKLTPEQRAAETPEQKEIRLLKNRLEKQTKRAITYHGWWIEDRNKLQKAQNDLSSCQKASGHLLSAVESMQRTEDIKFETYKTQVATFERIAKHADADAAMWKKKYEDLKTNIASPPASNFAEEAADRIVKKYDWLFDGIAAYNKNSQPSADKKEDLPSHPISPKDSDIRLICIDTGIKPFRHPDGSITEQHGTGLVYLERYTSPGSVIDKRGALVYPINELGGDTKLAERFHICEEPAKTKRGRPKKN